MSNELYSRGSRGFMSPDVGSSGGMSLDYLDKSSFFSFLSELPIIGNFFDSFAGNNAAKATMAYNSEQAAENRRFQHSERVDSQEWYEHMWNLSNEYNSPLEQLNRLKQAGFTANALFGGNQQPSAANISMPSVGSGGVASIGDLGSGYLNRSLERKLLESQANNLDKSSGLIGEQTIGQHLENQYNEATLQVRIDQQDQYFKNMVSQGLLTDAQYQEIAERLPYVGALQSEELRKRKAEADNLTLKFYEIQANIANLYKDLEVKDSVIDVNYSQSALNESTVEKQELEKKLLGYEVELKSIELQAARLIGLPPNASTGAFLMKEISEFKTEWKGKSLMERVSSMVGLAGTALMFVPGAGSVAGKAVKAIGKGLSKILPKVSKASSKGSAPIGQAFSKYSNRFKQMHETFQSKYSSFWNRIKK